MSIYFYKYMYLYSILMIISKKLDRLDLEIHEIGYEKHLTIDRDVAYH
jgi:hypothetical protein